MPLQNLIFWIIFLTIMGGLAVMLFRRKPEQSDDEVYDWEVDGL
jgi:hypothetical protein